MSAVSDSIENFIIDMLADSADVELQRNELAQYFGCSPSQINYVLTTRFSLDKGYVITSKRGGGGHITLARISLSKDDLLSYMATEGVGDELTYQRGKAIVSRLFEAGIISKREAALMLSALADAPFDKSDMRDLRRASTMKKMLLSLIKEGN